MPTGALARHSAVAITEKPGGKILGLPFMWRGRPNIRFHAATDWATRDAPEISHVLHKTETLAIRVSEVLSGTSERIAMQWLLSIGGSLLSVVDGSEKKVNRQELAAAAKRSRAELAQVESYYDRAGEKTGRLVYFWGMLIGILVLGLVAIPGALIFRIFGSYSFDDPAVRDFFVCYALGAVGAIVSVMTRMAQKSGSGFIDYEVGRPSPAPSWKLPADHRRGLRIRRLSGAEERPRAAATGRREPVRVLLRDARFPRRLQRAQGDGDARRGGEDARRQRRNRRRRLGVETPDAGADNGPGGRRARLSVAVETAAPESVVPDQTGLPDEITLAVGGEQTLLLPSSAGAGYIWEAAVDDEAVVEASTKFEDAGAKGAARPKFGENELLTLRGRAEGRTAVRLVQRRTWEEGVAPIAAHALTVNVAAAEATEPGGTQ